MGAWVHACMRAYVIRRDAAGRGEIWLQPGYVRSQPGYVQLQPGYVRLQAVLPGEELTIAYVDVNLPRSARQKHLRACYHFDCACARCLLEASDAAPRQKLSYQQARRGPKRREENARPNSAPGLAPVAGGAQADAAQDTARAKPKPKPKANVPWFESLA